MTGTLETTTPAMFESGVEKIKPNLTALDKQITRVIFFAGDVITDNEKYTMPSRAFGGIDLSKYKTIKTASKKGMLYRCALTPLKPKMSEINKRMVDPVQKGNWETGYIIENGKKTEFGYEDLTVQVDTLLYKKRYPGDEIQFILRATQPLGEGGIVEVTALKGAPDAEIRDAQYFFFPNWDEILNNPLLLPQTPAALDKYLRAKLTEANALESITLRTKYVSIARDMIRSNTEYSNWALKYVKAIETKNNARKVKGLPYGYSAKAEMVLPQLGRSRKDDLTDDSNSATRDLVTEMRDERKSANAIASEQLELEKRKLDLEERRLAIEEAKLGLGKSPSATSPQPIVAETLPTTDLPVFNVGDKVILGGISGTVQAKPFGRVKVEFADGTTQMADRSELESVLDV